MKNIYEKKLTPIGGQKTTRPMRSPRHNPKIIKKAPLPTRDSPH